MDKYFKPNELFQPLLTQTGLLCFGLRLQSHPVSPILSGIVHSYLQIRASKATPYPMIPDATQAVFIAPHGSIIGGAQSKVCDIQILQAGDYFGIRFYPGAIRNFFDLDLSDITDQFVDPGYFPCSTFANLHKHIYAHNSFLQRAQLCEQWLLQHFKPGPLTMFDYALSLIYKSLGGIRISQLALELGCSRRHLNRLFRRYTGLSSKSFAQTIRLQHACKQLCDGPTASLATASQLGFFDQAHLLKDFHKHLLLSPRLFFDQFKSDFYNH